MKMAEGEYPEATTLMWKGNIDGRIEALSRMLEMPDRLIMKIEQDLEDKKQQQQEEEVEDGS